MDLSGRTILITGGATGIGLALAEGFVAAGSGVLICGRRMKKLQEAAGKLHGIHVMRCDVSLESERRRLLRWGTTRFPKLDMLVNNAGIQREVDFTSGMVAKNPAAKDDEIAVNLVAPIRLCALFIPHLAKKNQAGIVNISSGLGFVPIASIPIYCATKAAIHSFTTSLRHQLRSTSIRVFEAVPPTTDTELDSSFAGEEEHAYRGISPREVAAAVLKGIEANVNEIVVGEAKRLHLAARRDPDAMFHRLNR